MNNPKLSRREILTLAMASAGGISLRSLLTGLPIHFITRRSLASTTGSYLIFSSNGNGDPFNCNVPGTYKPGFDHATAFSEPVNMKIGNENHLAAPVWNTLNSEIKTTANFFHLSSGTNAHTELSSVITAFGAIQPISGQGSEMLPSIISYEMSKLLGTHLQSPIALGSLLSFKGRNQKIYKPSEIKTLFPSGLSNTLISARAFRDREIDSIYSNLKTNGTPAQRKFIDEHIVSGNKARLLGEQLSEALESVTDDSAESGMKTAAALLALNVTPAVTMKLAFGGDNHADNGLVKEVSEHTGSIAAINTLYDSLKGYNIADKTHFALLNVFGRTTATNQRGGRDHWGPHTVMFSFGPNIKGGMIGDATQVGRFYRAVGINSQTGKTQNPDIDPEDTLKSAAKSLIAASGIEKAKVDQMVNGGKIVEGYLK